MEVVYGLLETHLMSYPKSEALQWDFALATHSSGGTFVTINYNEHHVEGRTLHHVCVGSK